MYMSVVTRDADGEAYGELAGARIAISGLSQTQGVDLSRAFADCRARLFVQMAERSQEMVELGALLAQTATELRIDDTPLHGTPAPTRFMQKAAQACGGLDAVVNIVSVTHAEMRDLESLEEIEAFVVGKLSALREITDVAANRMALTWSEGLVLNVVLAPAPQSSREAALLGMLRTALAAMTHDQATRWAGEAVRINAVGPKSTTLDAMSGACLTSEPDIAALALYLASRKGRGLTGHVFDAEGVARRGC